MPQVKTEELAVQDITEIGLTYGKEKEGPMKSIPVLTEEEMIAIYEDVCGQK